MAVWLQTLKSRCDPPSVEHSAGSASLFSTLRQFLILAFALFSGTAVLAAEAEPGRSAGLARAETHWSLRPLEPVSPPVSKAKAGSRNPIDQFIVAKLEEKGLSPNPSADKITLLRRVTFNLTGLPPTPEEVRGFLADRAADAYPRAVERLLASPRYGERWARHWMDVVHFAETHGNDQDRIRTNAWPYRDYLVRSFNADKSYARFVQEQLAGDILFPHDPDATVALGFIAAGPWDESSLRDIREDTVDRQIARYLDRDDMVATAMSTFASSTVHCARCHDHKFDPISQEDYYSLQAVFAGVDRADRAYDSDPKVHAQRQALLRQQRALDAKEPAVMASLLETPMRAEVAVWEKSLLSNVVTWTVLDSLSLVTSNGTVLTAKNDRSWLASGPRPEKDTYVFAAQPTLEDITAFRLEVLSDETLPQKGPGRQDNGNLHLSEFKVLAKTEGANEPQTVPLANASADFDQKDWTSAHAIDGKEKTAWGIHPKVGQSHLAIFEVKRGFALKGITALTLLLEQNHGGGHLIGRFRLSVTAAPQPVRVQSFPDSIASVLRLAGPERSREQQIELAAYYLQKQIREQLSALPKPQLVYAGANDFVPDGGLVPAKEPRLIQVLKRGDVAKPGAEAKPGALSAVPALPARFKVESVKDEGSRRVALAQWIAHRENPLTWRSIVNRVWHYHFTRGIVDSPNDFGRMGGAPSHPEMLDWLAIWFREQGGSLKALHRLIVTSATYQQSTAEKPAFSSLDADNRFLWRMNRTRLDAESVRDAILQITGDLDLTMGGPSVKQFTLAPGVHVTPVIDYNKFDAANPENRRRSIYRFLFRTLPDPFMDSLDCPEGSQLAPTRGASVTALQALSMWNNQFVVHQSERFAQRIAGEKPTLPGQINLAYGLALNRPPSRSEARELLAYARKHGLANLCRLILNSNEFMFVD